MDEQLVSVIIPTYNRKYTIKRAVDSVLNQTYKNIELIIVDDGSTDGTYEFVAEQYGDLENIQYVFNEENLGAGGSRNVGVQYANGDIIAFQDSDDEWLPNKLEEQMKLFSICDDSIGMVYSRFEYRLENGKTLAFYPSAEFSISMLNEQIFPFMLTTPLVGTPTVLMRKAYFIEIGGFDLGFRMLEDYEFFLRFTRRYGAVYIETPLVIVHLGRGRVSEGNVEEVISHCTILSEFYTDLMEWNVMDYKLSQLHNRFISMHCEKEFLHLLANMEEKKYREYAKAHEVVADGN